MKFLISACILGVPCRYDGKSKPSEQIEELMLRHTLIPICPETAGGLPTPRTPCEIVGAKVISKNGEDRTLQYMNGAKKCLELFKKEGCDGVILKTKSPSCGKGLVYDGSFGGTLTSGDGITAKLFKFYGIKIYTEEDIPLLLNR
ncbi:MAG: DUF523 domain-containing protein [Ruminococcaceae bacterium]|nr:DUF523 domain-containing protein [Oscillospiraceae bacterium]